VFAVLTKILSVLSWFAGTALFIYFEVRGRFAFYWPLLGILAMFAFYYLVLFIASRVAA
jgi:transposase